MKESNSISKRKLWQYVNQKTNRLIHHYHVLSVITILFEEMVKDLIKGQEIKIHNFGTLVLKVLKPRRYFDVTQQKIMQSKGYKIIRFTLAPTIRKKIVSRLDTTAKDD